MKKKIIIFGATGNTGAYLVDYCLENLDQTQYEIIAVGRRKTDYFTKRGIAYYSVDISKINQFEKLPTEGIFAILLLAGILPANMEGYHPMEYINCNIIGAFNVLEYCRKTNVDRVIYTQTIRDIGENIGKIQHLKHDMIRNFSYTGDHAIYVITKNTAVDLIEHYHQEYGIKRFIFRLPTIYSYSPNEYYYVDGIKNKMAFRHMIDQAITGKSIEMWGDPNKAHDVVYVKDFCQMLCKAITVDQDRGFYNVGTGIPISLKEQIEGMIEVFSPDNHSSKITLCPDKPNSRSYSMDISNAVEELGYAPKYDYIGYLRDFKSEMEINRYKDLR
ncbi:NAD(P)-dependent oxidoreductase [Clostridium tagluense]|nr:NAD(P)-dependent oxidoreductase [Clostridium tagluense]